MTKKLGLQIRLKGPVTLAAIICLSFLSSGQVDAGEKTLVSWVSLRDGDYSGGSVLTLQRGEVFDAIVFGEVKEKTWMAGSDQFERTNHQQNYAPERTGNEELIQIAIVYQNDRMALYRNGKQLTSYPAEQVDLLKGDKQVVVFGVRHLVGGDGHIEGEIDDARIYARALSAEQIQSLRPNQASAIEPWAWWDFEGGELKDRTGRFKHARLAAGAAVKGGRLRLTEGSVVVATQNEETMEWAVWSHAALVRPEEYEPETPVMPAKLPESWLTYHLAHPGPGRAVPGDPNAALYYKGRYHLHYIYRSKYGFCFAHLSGDDLVHWKWRQTVLTPPITGHGMFSGTAFFTKEGQPAIIYHGEGSSRNWIAYAEDDNLDKWSKPQPVVPKAPGGEEAESTNWDPDCWLRDGTYYAISGGRPPELMKSNDLKEWAFLGKLFHDDTDWDALGVEPNEDVSCANMFKIGDKWMLLCISHELGCRYYLGGFKGAKYLPESHHLMNWVEQQYFAPESLLTPDGRRVMWVWWTADLSSEQTGVQSLPRELSLPDDGVLRIKPLRELERLRGDVWDEEKIVVVSGDRYRLTKIAGDTLELSVTLEPNDAQEYGIRVLCDREGEGLSIAYNPATSRLTVGTAKAPLELKRGEGLELRVFLDKELVEVFANDRQAVVACHKYKPSETGIELFSEGDTIQVMVKGWPMRSIYSSK